MLLADMRGKYASACFCVCGGTKSASTVHQSGGMQAHAKCKLQDWIGPPLHQLSPAIAMLRARMRVTPLPLPLFLTLDITTRPHPRVSLAVSTVHSAAAGKLRGAPAHLAALSHG